MTLLNRWPLTSALVAFCLFVAVPSLTLASDGLEGEVNAGTSISPLENWQLFVGFVLPLVISVIVQRGWSQATQSVAMFLVCAVVTAGTMYLQGDLDNITDYAESLLKLVALTVAFYKGVWKPTQVSPTIEEKTTL